jgi:signal transduction histidine kinase/ActR/RegA family two-component response regulator
MADRLADSATFVSRSKTFSRAAAVFVIVVGASVMMGWLFDITRLKSIYGVITMKANAALNLILMGVSLWVLRTKHRNTLRMVGQACAATAAFIGLLTLSQHVFGWNLLIDQLLFSEQPGALATTSPGRMGITASSDFIMFGVAMLLLYRRRAVLFAQLLSMVAGFWALLAVIGYAYQAEELFGIARYTGIALPTAVALSVLSFGILGACVDEGILLIFCDEGAAGIMARRLALVGVGVPLILGWLRLGGQRAGHFDLGFGTALLISGIIVTFILAIWRVALKLKHIDEQRLIAEQERERLLRQERTLRIDAERAARSKDEFLATVSHELRTPLNAILGWATMLRKSPVDEATAIRGMEAIERNAKAQAQLVEDLLDVSRIISGTLRLDVKPIALTSVIKAAMDSVQPAADAKEIHLQIIVDPTADNAKGDAARLQQVIWNLLSNSIKFTPKGGEVSVSVERSDSMAEVTVTDTGDGIRRDFLPFVFERFKQADGSITRKHAGLGLGLAIARHLMELHGGTIEAESAGEGLGSAFKIKLPIGIASTTEGSLLVESATRAALSDVALTDPPDLNGIRILIVDDDGDAREMLQAVLEESNADVTTASSARDAIDLLSALRPHVLVSDIGMPELDGYALIERIRKLSPEAGGNIPAIALTGYVRVEERMRALEAGYQMFVPKPVDVGELATMILDLLGRGVSVKSLQS